LGGPALCRGASGVENGATHRDEFLPKAALSPDHISGTDSMTRDAIDFKFMQAPLSKEQLAALIQIPSQQ
jgi:NitT/TauT family transport system substrate-binding protein